MKTGEALDVAAQVASALVAAHEAGIVHRDIKPENIMLRRDGYVKVLDFGLAKLTETVAPQPVDTSAPTLPLAAHTETGVVLGTAQYMSPEQAAGKKVDARSDIFSFGVVLYEMVAGQRAFQGASLIETVAAILNQEPKPLPAKVPPELAKVILRCSWRGRVNSSVRRLLEFKDKWNRQYPITALSRSSARAAWARFTWRKIQFLTVALR
jgi:serine/threonine-protein kinase